MPGLAGVDVLGELRRRLRTPVIVENDVNLAALGELRYGVAAGVDDFVLIAIGTGIGMGIVAGGQLQRGARGGAGEIGFLPFGSDPTTAEAKNGGAFELAAAGPAIRARIQEATSGNRTMLTEGATFAEALRAASAGDVVAQTLVEEEAHLIALGIASVVAILDPALVVLGGGVGANDGLLEPVGRHLATLVLAPPRIVTAHVSASGPPWSARSPPPSTWPTRPAPTRAGRTRSGRDTRRLSAGPRSRGGRRDRGRAPRRSPSCSARG